MKIIELFNSIPKITISQQLPVASYQLKSSGDRRKTYAMPYPVISNKRNFLTQCPEHSTRQDGRWTIRERNLEFGRLPKFDKNGFRKGFFVGNLLFFPKSK